ncbi:PGF-pre-PGF domain-containing protein [Candidatus Woesearchaeota archaeon]|nr:PGF-pre-PGF domain-containing protein [Candidatus Woesearchaeota archaeon]
MGKIRAYVFMAVITLLAFAPGALAASLGCLPPGAGDWVLNGSNTTICDGEYLAIDGDINISFNSSLIISNSNISMANHDINMFGNSSLRLENSNHSSSQDIYLYYNSTLGIKDSYTDADLEVYAYSIVDISGSTGLGNSGSDCTIAIYGNSFLAFNQSDISFYGSLFVDDDAICLMNDSVISTEGNAEYSLQFLGDSEAYFYNATIDARAVVMENASVVSEDSAFNESINISQNAVLVFRGTSSLQSFEAIGSAIHNSSIYLQGNVTVSSSAIGSLYTLDTNMTRAFELYIYNSSYLPIPGANVSIRNSTAEVWCGLTDAQGLVVANITFVGGMFSQEYDIYVNETLQQETLGISATTPLMVYNMSVDLAPQITLLSPVNGSTSPDDVVYINLSTNELAKCSLRLSDTFYTINKRSRTICGEEAGIDSILAAELNHMRSLFEYRPELNSSHLFELLSNSSFIDEVGLNQGTTPYTNRLVMVNNTARLIHFQDDALAPDFGSYLHFRDNAMSYAYQYILEFSSPVEYDNSSAVSVQNDLLGIHVELMGESYNITSIGLIDGVLNNITLSGPDEYILADGQKVQKGGNSVQGSVVWLSASEQSTGGNWTGINISWQPDDDTYINMTGSLADPVFGRFSFTMDDVSPTFEEISVEVMDVDGEIQFKNSDSQTVQIPLYADNVTGDVWFGTGDEPYNRLYYGTADNSSSIDTLNTTATANCYLNTSSNVTDCEGARWLVVNGSEVHIVELLDIDPVGLKVDFFDLTYDVTDTGNDFVFNATTDVYLSGIGTVSLYVANNAENATVAIKPVDSITSANTSYSASLAQLWTNNTHLCVAFTENSGTALSASTLATVNVTVFYNSTNKSLLVGMPEINSSAGPLTGFGFGPYDKNSSSNDVKLWGTYYGSEIEYDSATKQSLIIRHPSSYLSAPLYVITDPEDNTSKTHAYNITGIHSGDYTVYVNCTDSNNNVGKTEIDFTIDDSTAPAVVLTYPANYTGLSSATTLVTLTVTTDEKAYCNYSTDSGFDPDKSLSMTVTGGLTHTQDVSVTSGTRYNYYYRCWDPLGYMTPVIHHYFRTNVDLSPASPGGSSSSRDGPVGEGADTDEVKALFIDLAENDTIEIDINSSLLYLTEFRARVLENVSGYTRFNIKSLGEKPDDVAEAAGFKVFQYIQLDHQNIISSSLDGIVLEFKVSEQWLSSNNLAASNVFLLRYDGAVWSRLETEFTGEDSGMSYFRAVSPGLSLYAIAAECSEDALLTAGQDAASAGQQGAAAQPDGTAPDNASAAGSGAQQSQFMRDDEGGMGLLTLIMIILVLLILAGAGVSIYLYREYSKKTGSTLTFAQWLRFVLDNLLNKLKKDKSYDQDMFGALQDTQADALGNEEDIFTVLCREFLMNLQQGMDPRDIMQLLNSEGYPPDLVNKAMVDIRNLVDYIRTELGKGFSPEVIRMKLVHSGWKIEDDIITTIEDMLKNSN